MPHRFYRIVLLAGAVAACQKETPKTTVADTAELTLAGRDSTAVPQLRDQPLATQPQPAPATVTPAPQTRPSVAARAPVEPATISAPTSRATQRREQAQRVAAAEPEAAPAPVPAPAPKPVVRREIASGTALVFRTASRVCETTTKPGASFQVALDEPVSGRGGANLSNASATARLVSVTPDENGNNTFNIAIDNITSPEGNYAVQGDVAQVQTERHDLPIKKSTVGKGALLGALGGILAGRSIKSAVIGTAAGVAAGTAVGAATRGYEMCIPAGGTMSLKLSSPIEMGTSGNS